MEFLYEGNSLKGGVYKITNKLNGRIYIGSAKEFKNRWKQHSKSLEKGKHHNKHLQASYNKHGKENFIFQILEVVEGTTRQRRKIEQKYIDQYIDNWELCFNLNKHVNNKQGKWSKNPEITRLKMRMAKLNKLRGPQTEETKAKIGLANSFKTRTESQKKKISLIMLNKKRSSQTKEKISKTMKEKGIKPPSWFGKKHSKETIQKLSKKVGQYNLNGELIEIFISISSAEKKINLAKGSITKCCKGQRKTAGGFIWRYE